MPQVVASAHNLLFHLSLSEDVQSEEPSELVREFHDRAARNGHTVGDQSMQEMHVQGFMSLDERVAGLVMEGAREVYPDIFS